MSGVTSAVSSAVTYDEPLQSIMTRKEGARRVFGPGQSAVDICAMRLVSGVFLGVPKIHGAT